MSNKSNIINLSNCKNCGSPRDIYRSSCEFCNTFYEIENKQEKGINVPTTNCSGIPLDFTKFTKNNGSGNL